jgi:hypothetical protein
MATLFSQDSHSTYDCCYQGHPWKLHSRWLSGKQDTGSDE